MYDQNNMDELQHYGVKGMRWGHRKKYYTESGKLNSLGRARQAYKDAKQERKEARKDLRSANRFAFGITGISNANKARKSYNTADAKTVAAKAKYNAAKAKNSEKAKKAEMRTYIKEMSKSGIVGSAADSYSGGRSTSLYNSIRAQKGKAYADTVHKKVQNRTIRSFAGSFAVGAGMLIVSSMLKD